MSNAIDTIPVCCRCETPMKLVITIPKIGLLPELLVFHCVACGDTETRELTRERHSSVFEPTLESFAGQPNGGLMLPTDTFTRLREQLIADLAVRNRLSTISAYDGFSKDGGLMYYSVIFGDQFRQAATYANRILKGAKPTDLPVQRPVKLD